MNHKVDKTRRKVLKAALSFPIIIPASVLGAQGAVAPSNRITMGFIGVGKQNGWLLEAFLREDNAQVVACCDVEPKRLVDRKGIVERYYADKRKSEKYSGCDTYSDFRELLARDDIDAVSIATPDHWHAVMAIAACRAGKDIYCEKPLSLTISEARAMVNAARRYERVFQTGSMQRSDAKFRFACEMVRSGRIGKVHTVHVNVGGPSVPCDLPEEPCIPGLDWNGWIGPAPMRPYNSILCPDHTNSYPNWRNYMDYSGGGMTDWGAHHFDIAQWGLGMDASGPVEITPPDGKDVERLTYRYANGVTMYHGGAQGNAGVEFKGTEGRVLVNRGYLETDPSSLMRTPTQLNEVHLYDSNNHYRDFLDCVKTRQKPICDVEIGCRSATVCHLGNIAYWLKRPLKWDPVKEEFIGDPLANRWLDRSRREPWTL